MFEDYQGKTPDLYKRYIDDVIGASSVTRQDLENFIHFCTTYHPAIKYTFEISESSIPFLDLCLCISNDRVSTSIHYCNPPILTTTLSILPPTLLTARMPFNIANFSVFVGSALMMVTMMSNLPK